MNFGSFSNSAAKVTMMMLSVAPKSCVHQEHPPKKSLTAFFNFKSDVYDQIKRESPDLKMTELTKIMSMMWSNLPLEIKARYERKCQELKEEYERKMRQYETSQRAGEINSSNNPSIDKSTENPLLVNSLSFLVDCTYS